MMVGLILECQVDGPDERVLRRLLENFAPEITVRTAPQTNKAALLQSCGVAARQLLADGCDRIVIVWDLYPADWGDALRQKDRQPCRHRDREKISEALLAADVNVERVFLVAIEFMLESWLIADRRAVAAFLSKRLGRPITRAQLGSVSPAAAPRPKDVLSKMFERNQHAYYRDNIHAAQIAQEITDLSDLKKRCPTFLRFWEKVTRQA